MDSFKADFFIGLRVALHSRLSSIALWIIATLVVIVLLSVQFSARQPATVALDVGLSVIRLSLPLLAILMIQETIGREFERKLYLTSFTYPRTRARWMFGRAASTLLVVIVMLVLMGIVLALLTTFASKSYEQATPISLGLPYFATLLFIAVDLLVTIAIATLIAISATTPSFVLIGTIGFIIIARSYSPIISLLRSNPGTLDKVADPGIYQDSLGLLTFILPDLGRLDIRLTALYDSMVYLPHQWQLLLVATLIYVLALFTLSVWVLNKREFS